ncbi:MAG: hypothetical protein JHC26_01425 [Thermofilum sp.]|jgi:hypothetical protein|uniref:hypothetical protein n=1 Tax=Thermofilum sp. TaxID=1961369 RepID=UPI00258E2BAB|nr:hypothetical protein [Thermofilum sp.]MCI4407721.1 hypothetical protein [Thermofilum sp.]
MSVKFANNPLERKELAEENKEAKQDTFSVIYTIRDKAVPYILARLFERSRKLYLAPIENKLVFVGSPYDTERMSLIHNPTLIEVNAPSKFIDDSLLLMVKEINKETNRDNKAILHSLKQVKERGEVPRIGINDKSISLWGATYDLRDPPQGEIDAINEVAKWFYNKNPRNSVIVEFSGEDLLELINKLNSYRDSNEYYGGEDEIRFVVQSNGEAYLELVNTVYDEDAWKRGIRIPVDERVVWRKRIKVIEPPKREKYVESASIDSLFKYFWIPLFKPKVNIEGRNEYHSTIPIDSLKNAKIAVYFDKEDVNSFGSGEYVPSAVKMRIGDTIIYTTF